MVTQYAFAVLSDRCSGCKTCQVACKDHHDLPAGVHFRRVFEVTAGGWVKKDAAWTTDVSAYYLSVACHHCTPPVCAALCASDAIWKRPDGIVLIDDTRCTRCRKCESDCPYKAVRWDPFDATVRKCDGCVEEIDQGRHPACVTACPNRALEFGELDELTARFGAVNQVFPLPDEVATSPALVIRPHRDASTIARLGPEVGNWEEL